MTSSKNYRVKLFSGADSLAQSLIILAAKANGGQWLSLEDMKNVVDGQKLLYPTIHDGYTAEIIGDKILHLDVPAGGGEYKTVLAIEERELFEMEETMTEEEARNILDELDGFGGLAD